MPSRSTDSAPARLASPTGYLVAVFAVLLVVAAGLLGFGNLLAVPIRLALVALGIWLLSRVVVAVERLADAHERLAGSPAAAAAAGAGRRSPHAGEGPERRSPHIDEDADRSDAATDPESDR